MIRSVNRNKSSIRIRKYVEQTSRKQGHRTEAAELCGQSVVTLGTPRKDDLKAAVV